MFSGHANGGHISLIVSKLLGQRGHRRSSRAVAPQPSRRKKAHRPPPVRTPHRNRRPPEKLRPDDHARPRLMRECGAAWAAAAYVATRLRIPRAHRASSRHRGRARPIYAPDRPWITRPASRSTRPSSSSCSAGGTFSPVSKHATPSPPGSTNTTPTEGIPPTACSARSTTNAPAQHNVEPSTASTNTTVGRRHEPQRDGFAAAVPPRPRRAEATWPPLRTQGSLSRCWVVSSTGRAPSVCGDDAVAGA